MGEHFCNCPSTKCPKHPTNHSDGCDPCMQDNIAKKKMPACMFRAVHDDVSSVSNFSIQGFVDFYHTHRDELAKDQ